MSALVLTWAEVERECSKVAHRWIGVHPTSVYGIPRGGVPVALLVREHLQRLGHYRVDLASTFTPGTGTLVVDDLIESGETLARVGKPEERVWFDALVVKPGPMWDLERDRLKIDRWVVFPWEVDEPPATDGLLRIVQALHLDVAPSDCQRAMRYLSTLRVGAPERDLLAAFVRAVAAGEPDGR